MHLIIAAFLYLGLTTPGSTITSSEIVDHQAEVEEVQSDPEFIEFCNRLVENAGIFTVDIDEIH